MLLATSYFWKCLNGLELCWAAWGSFRAIARGVFREAQFLLRLILRRTVAKADSIGLVVRMCTQCSAGKS